MLSLYSFTAAGSLMKLVNLFRKWQNKLSAWPEYPVWRGAGRGSGLQAEEEDEKEQELAGRGGGAGGRYYEKEEESKYIWEEGKKEVKAMRTRDYA